jgi:hypothetical protein
MVAGAPAAGVYERSGRLIGRALTTNWWRRAQPVLSTTFSRKAISSSSRRVAHQAARRNYYGGFKIKFEAALTASKARHVEIGSCGRRLRTFAVLTRAQVGRVPVPPIMFSVRLFKRSMMLLRLMKKLG